MPSRTLPIRDLLVRGFTLAAVSAIAAASCDGATDDSGDDALATGDSQTTIQLTAWQGQVEVWDEILQVFEDANPDVDVEYVFVPAVEYDGFLDESFAAGDPPDVMGCFGYDWALQRYEGGQFADLTALTGMDDFSPSARATWSTDDGAITYCVPVVASMTGFFYNREIFADLGLAPPVTEAEFVDVLQAIQNDGRYTPLGFGLESAWVGSGLGYENIGPQYWHGETGRLSLIAGSSAFTDEEFVDAFEQLEVWADHLPDGAATLSRIDGQAMLFQGTAAIIPGGSWEIEPINTHGLDIGVFRAPDPDGGACFFNEHPDLGFALADGVETSGEAADAARRLVEWFTTPEFASVYMAGFPGLFTLQDTEVAIDDPLAAEMFAWRDECAGSPRLTGQILSRDVDLETVLAEASIDVLAGRLSAADAAAQVQAAYLGDG